LPFGTKIRTCKFYPVETAFHINFKLLFHCQGNPVDEKCEKREPDAGEYEDHDLLYPPGSVARKLHVKEEVTSSSKWDQLLGKKKKGKEKVVEGKMLRK
jgi:hypothetical protein